MSAPTLLLGAFDRHNFGDLLFPHIAAALLPGSWLIFAGLAERDLRPFGGHRTHALAHLAAELGNMPVRIIHVGGEILTCEAWHAALMLQSPAAVPALVARLDAHPAERLAWARSTLGLASLAPYVAGRRLFPRAQLLHVGVGGANLALSPPALRAEVTEALREAAAVGVRDRQTLGHLHAAGIPAHLMPDPAVLTAERFGPTIAAHDSDLAGRDAWARGHLGIARRAGSPPSSAPSSATTQASTPSPPSSTRLPRPALAASRCSGPAARPGTTMRTACSAWPGACPAPGCRSSSRCSCGTSAP